MTNYIMKAISQIKRLPALICISLLVLFAACSKDESGSSAPPVITGVSLLDSAHVDSTFSEALPGILVLITGQHLDGIVKVSFNGLDAYFNPTYNTSTHLIVTIPDKTPTEATDPDVPNQIYILTNHGEATYTFTIEIPPPSIAAISNENALAGDSLIVYGSSLWLIDKIVFPGGREVTDFIADDAGTRLGMIMPALGDDTGRLVIYAKYGNATSDGPLNDHQSGNVISNLTADWETGEKGIFNWAYWGANRTTDPNLFPGTRGGYLQNVFGGVGKEDAAWWNGNRSGNFNEVPMFTAAIMTEQASSYALKFEMSTKEPWTAGVNVLRFGDNYAFRFMPWSGADGGKFETKGQWRTITVPLSLFKTAADGVEGTGAGAAVMGDLLKAGGVVAFGYRFITEENPVDVYNAAFDNFRIVKIR